MKIAKKEIEQEQKHIQHKGEKEVHYVYILQCKDNTFYTGYTNNLTQRIRLHNEGKGAKYTRGRTPVALLYYETFPEKREALKREYAIKQLHRKQKERLIEKRELE